MENYFTGTRVSLRPFREGDSTNIYHALLDPEFRKLTGTQTFFTEDSLEKAYKNFDGDKSRIDLVITDETGAAIGDLALTEIDYINKNASLRIALYKKEHYGKGLGTEAISLLLQYAFEVLSLYRVYLNVYEYNSRAIRAYEKLGFVKEGIFRGELLWNGVYYDNLIMGILRHEFTNREGI
ncbi:GNAT family N-acetyltransferase [Bacillus infantis]|jgi:RimJ/RimL family protein N-acetyltransferase|uniref:GNAT family N-acetyltransferase n=1 Tax=Bacillus infantis TaxID=324767 RepID=UPI002155F267|nr:GNAT family protein [Bacillus infantis]MCR6609064.1 GNAT family N-acetyltransferase [Bacillus infantis]